MSVVSSEKESARWSVPGGALVEVLTTRDGVVVFGAGGKVWRCQGSCDALSPALPQANPAFSSVVIGRDGSLHAVSWPSEGGSSQLHSFSDGTWTAVQTANEPRLALPLSAGLAYSDTSNRLWLLGGSEEIALSEAKLNTLFVDPSGERILGRRAEDDAVVVSGVIGGAAPEWSTLDTKNNEQPAGFSADGQPVVVERGVWRKDTNTAPVSQLTALDATGGRRVLWSGVGSRLMIDGDAVVYVAADDRGGQAAVVQVNLTE